jgi:excisionase family DNA binding protein
MGVTLRSRIPFAASEPSACSATSRTDATRRPPLARSNDHLLSVSEVAEYLGIRQSWIYDNWRTEAIPFLRIGNQLRARRDDLDDWLKAQRAA